MEQNDGAALDVILLAQPDGSLKSTAWHVVFERIAAPTDVKVTVNGNALSKPTGLRAQAALTPALFIDGGTTPPDELLAHIGTHGWLRMGRNELIYATACGRSVRTWIYLWPQESQVIVFDVDGTITLNDVLGQLGNMVDQAWVHSGVCELACHLRARGYQIMFLTSRTLLGPAGINRTRRYLFEVVIDGISGFRLPPAPVCTTCHVSTVVALQHELGGKSEAFKTAVLQSMLALNAPSAARPISSTPAPTPRSQLFFAGFGNREKDARAYLSSGVPPERVFIIDPASVIRCRAAASLASLPAGVSVTDNQVASSTTGACSMAAPPPPVWHSYDGLLPHLDALFPVIVSEADRLAAFAEHAAKAAASLPASGDGRSYTFALPRSQQHGDLV